MMFAGLTSAYIVKSNQAVGRRLKCQSILVFNGTILVSSLLMQMALRSFKQREMNSIAF
jgi:cytochrome c oxidase subunit 3